MLDFSQVVTQIENFSVERASGRERLLTALGEAGRRLRAAALGWEGIQPKLLGSRTSWLVAEWKEIPDSVVTAAESPSQYVVYAADGSQIVSDRHDIALCYLLNVSRIVLQYGENAYAELSSSAVLSPPEEDLEQEAVGELTAIAGKKVEVNRQLAQQLGINPSVVDSILYDAFGQRVAARIYTRLNQYFVILEVDPDLQLGPNALTRIYATSSSGQEVPLSAFAKMTSTVAPIALNHQGQFPSVTLSFNLPPNVSIGAAVTAIQQAEKDLHLPASIATSFQGSAQAFQTSLSSTPILILAALVAVYIILGMLYESTIHPITIISTLPSAGLGALLTLMLFGMPLDVIGIIGIILLIGIVKKNGIMLVDFALVGQRDHGLSTEKAIHEACRLRFRPILMTTMCALLGGVPLMLGTGIGSEIRQPLGYAIVGGLLVSQLLTLFTTPVVYIYMDRLGHWLSRGRSAPVEANVQTQ